MKKCYLYLLFLPMLLCLIYACQEELGAILNQEGVKQNQNIKEAKAIFEALSPDFPCLQARSVNAATKSVVIEPAWDGAFEDEDKDYQTVESNIRLSKPFYMIDKASHDAYKQTKDARYLNYLSRAVVLTHKKTGVSDAFIMVIIGSREYMEKHDFQLWEVTYFNIPDDFSGMILYYSLNGAFVNGWQIKENRQILPFQQIPREDAGLFSRSTTGCFVVEVTNTYVDCITYSGTTFTTYEGEQYSSDFSDTVCGEPYDETYTYLVCDDSNGSSGNTGGYSPPTSSNGREKYFGFIPQIVTANIDYFIEWLEDKDCISRKILTYVDDYQITNFSPVNIAINPVKVSETQAGAFYSPSDNTIYLRSAEDTGRLFTLYEEFIHSIQCAIYTEDERERGGFNIEFEAKLLIDYIRFSLNKVGDTILNDMSKTEPDGFPKTLRVFLAENQGNEFDISAFYLYANHWKQTADIIYQQKNFDTTLEPRLIRQIVNDLEDSCFNLQY